MYDLLSKADWLRMGDTLRQLTPGAKRRINQLKAAEKRYEDHRCYHTAMLLEAAGILIAGGMDIESVSVIVAGSAKSKIERINTDLYIPEEDDKGGNPADFWTYERLSKLRESMERAKKGKKSNHSTAIEIFIQTQKVPAQTPSTPPSDGFDDLFTEKASTKKSAIKKVATKIRVHHEISGKVIYITPMEAAKNANYRTMHIHRTIENRIKYELRQGKHAAALLKKQSDTTEAWFEDATESDH